MSEQSRTVPEKIFTGVPAAEPNRVPATVPDAIGVPVEISAKKPSRRENYFIMCGHAADDLCQGSLPAVLAFMYQQGLLHSYSQVAFLILMTTVVNAVAQPLTGFLADKRPMPYLMCAGMLTAALGVAFLGFTENYWLMLALVAVNGVGVATFHPSAGKLANTFAGTRVGKGMSIFSVGGNVGYAVGPLYFTALYAIFGLKATVFLLVPALVMSVIFIRKNRFYRVSLKRAEQKMRRRVEGGNVKENYSGTAILLLLVFSRSASIAGLTTFLPLYFMHVLGQSEQLAALSLTLIGIGGAVATFFGGPMADRFGFTQFVRFTSLLCVPFGVLFLFPQNVWLCLPPLVLFGVFFYAAMSPVVVIGQKMLPLHVGMATGITIGLGISFGGLVAPLLGTLGDRCGLSATMDAVVAISVLSFLFSLFVPVVNRPKKRGNVLAA